MWCAHFMEIFINSISVRLIFAIVCKNIFGLLNIFIVYFSTTCYKLLLSTFFTPGEVHEL